MMAVGGPLGSLSDVLRASDQLLSLACAAIVPRCRNSPVINGDHQSSPAATNDEGHPKRSTRCFLGDVPTWIIVDAIGRRWVIEPHRSVLVHFGEGSRTRGCRGPWCEYTILVRISHTLGIVGQRPVSVSLNLHVLGPVTNSMCVRMSEYCEPEVPDELLGDPHTNVTLWDARKGGDVALLIEDQVFPPLFCASNSKWVVMVLDVYDPCGDWYLDVWRLPAVDVESEEESANGGRGAVLLPNDALSVAGLKKITGKVVATSEWVNQGSHKPLMVRFFGDTEYTQDSNVLEVIASRTPEVENEGAQTPGDFKLCVFHLDLEGVLRGDSTPSFVCMRDLKYPHQLPDNLTFLSKPLINRSERVYFLAIPPKIVTLPASTQELLVLNTGDTIPWFTFSSTSNAQACDESHFIVTTSDFSTSQVFSLPKIHNQNSISEPCFVVNHPPGTAHVLAGCGLIVSSTHFLREVTPKPSKANKRRRLSTSARISQPYTTLYTHGKLPQVAMQHRFIDAMTGTLLFVLEHPSDGLLPRAISSCPLTTLIDNRL